MAHKKSLLITSEFSAIIIFLLLAQSLSLKCYVCDSGTEANCVNKLKDEFLKHCTVEETNSTTTVTESTTETTTSTTPEPTTTSTTPEPTTTLKPTTTSTTPEPTTTSSTATTTPKPTTTITPKPTTTTTPEPTTSTTTTTTNTTKPTIEESNSDEANKGLYSVKLIPRFARAISRENEDLVCYKTVKDERTIRGCARGKEKKCDGKEVPECYTCTTDACNSSPDFRFLSPILPLLVTITFILNR